MNSLEGETELKLKLPWRRSKSELAKNANQKQLFQNSLLEAGCTLRKRREELGISLRDLARETLITTAVLEAIERGWVERLPEAAYLCTMLLKLEEQLKLPAGSLNGALAESKNNDQAQSKSGLSRFTPGSIDVFTTWQGSIIYAVVMLSSLFALNLQQKRLAELNSQTLVPITANTQSIDNQEGETINDPALVGLRPLQAAKRRSNKQWLYSQLNQQMQSPTGLLEINLSQPKTLKINSGNDAKTHLTATKGLLRLELTLPLILEIKPPLGQHERVLWNGKPQEGKRGLYKIMDTSKRSIKSS
ncbi:MAG: helix-turn-helix domain-containing protein [Prochlorococcus sp.]